MAGLRAGVGRLLARARALGPAVDLLAFYAASGFFLERDGFGLVGSGVALDVALPDGLSGASETAAGALARVAGDAVDGPGSGPVAVGAFPFSAGSPGRLVVPRRTLRRHAGGPTWEVVIDGGDGEREEPAPFRPSRPDFGELRVRPVPEPAMYAAAVAEATRRIRAGELRKVVLARSLEVEAERTFDARALLGRLRSVDPGCYAFGVPAGDGAVLVGASPELLIRREGREVLARPLAGSAPRFSDPGEDRASAEGLLASAKNREEHVVVVEAIVEALGRLCGEVRADPEPHPIGTANVWHLATDIGGRLDDPRTSVLDLVAALHPTPAVCGWPATAAREAIAEVEPFDRGLYAGPVGWVDANGDGEWAIALRCAEVSGPKARVFAGAGIVADSDPDAEVEETEAKFRALLDALRWG
ncbi:MAG TPA: isochorismate synthase [Actinomycetota bacterium]|nr:isochorismate synthase [Actinomycetota bacterium]